MRTNRLIIFFIICTIFFTCSKKRAIDKVDVYAKSSSVEDDSQNTLIEDISECDTISMKDFFNSLVDTNYKNLDFDKILKAVTINEIKQSVDSNMFIELYLKKKNDSVDILFKFSKILDTIYIVETTNYETGDLFYSIWNKKDSITNNTYFGKMRRIELSPKLIDLIEKWDVYNLIHRDYINLSPQIYYTTRVIVKNNRFKIETIKHDPIY